MTSLRLPSFQKLGDECNQNDFYDSGAAHPTFNAAWRPEIAEEAVISRHCKAEAVRRTRNVDERGMATRAIHDHTETNMYSSTQIRTNTVRMGRAAGGPHRAASSGTWGFARYPQRGATYSTGSSIAASGQLRAALSANLQNRASSIKRALPYGRHSHDRIQRHSVLIGEFEPFMCSCRASMKKVVEKGRH